MACIRNTKKDYWSTHEILNITLWKHDDYIQMADRTALSVEQLAMGQMVQGSDIGDGKIFCTHPAQLQGRVGLGASCAMSTASPSWRQSGQVVALTTNPLLVLKLCVDGAIPLFPPASSRHVIVCHIYINACTYIYTHTHFICGDVKICAIQINQVRAVRTITDFQN
jgi:hypothetical protein